MALKHCPGCGVKEGSPHSDGCPEGIRLGQIAEPKIGANRGNAGKGRPKGSPNKTTQAAKEAIAEAFEKMGGTKALVDWADKSDDNRKVFYAQIWPKIVPLTVGGDPDNPLHHEIRRIRVEP